MSNNITKLLCVAVLCYSASAMASWNVLFSENFESYNNTTDMQTVWTPYWEAGVFVTQIDDDVNGTPEVAGKFAYHPGGGYDYINLPSSVVPTDYQWLRLSVDIYDNDTSLDPYAPLSPAVKRATLGMRNSTVGENILELGMYAATAHYAYRAILFDDPGAEPNWDAWDLGTEQVDGQTLPVNRFRGAGWIRYTVTIAPTMLVFDIDLGRDGKIDGSITYTSGVTTTANGYDQIRFGGPSGVTSAGGGVTYDNILLEYISAANPPPPGDVDRDGFVGLADLDLVLNNWNQTVPPADPRADPNGDNYIGLQDLDFILHNWNAGTPQPAIIPEPTASCLLVLSGLALLGRRLPNHNRSVKLEH